MSYVWQRVKVKDRSDKHNDRHYDDDASHHLINNLYAVGVEHRTNLVDKPRKTIPPEHCSGNDAEVAYAHFERMVGDDECELCKQSHHEHDDKGV